jgi:hypothetical protein
MRITRRPISGPISDTATRTHQLDVGGTRTSCARQPGTGYASSHGCRYEPTSATALMLVPAAPSGETGSLLLRLVIMLSEFSVTCPPTGPGRSLTFLLGQAAPDPVRLSGPQREREALGSHWALIADGLCRRHLRQACTRRRDREEQLRISRPAGGAEPPVFAGPSCSNAVRQPGLFRTMGIMSRGDWSDVSRRHHPRVAAQAPMPSQLTGLPAARIISQARYAGIRSGENRWVGVAVR